MSTVEADLDAVVQPVANEDLELTSARLSHVGSMEVRRMLPQRLRRSVGAWCFVDHYGPLSVDGVAGMNVPPHPHIGLQTVTWLMAGNVLHRDSLGTEQLIRPGQLNLMTAGQGIAHSEESPPAHDPVLHGVQLWVALPDRSRHAAPAFEHHSDLPATRAGGLDIIVLAGSLAGLSSPATMFSPILGAQLSAADAVRSRLDLDPAFEHVLFVTDGAAALAGSELRPGTMAYLATGREYVDLDVAPGTAAMLLGGVPLGEQLLMWWNFVARTPQEIQAAADEWTTGGFGSVGGYAGQPLAAPALDVARLIRRSPGSEHR